MSLMIRKLHKWVGLLLALQFLLWFASGVVMSLFDHHAVSGEHYRAPAPKLRGWPADAVMAPAAVLGRTDKPVESIESAWLLDRPVYRLSGQGRRWLLDAATGQAVAVSAADALTLARIDYTGPGPAAAPIFMEQAGSEARRHAGPVWRVDFQDKKGSTLYVSAEDGRVLERRNDLWRWFDVAWMLHIMDYAKRENFNHPLLIISSLAGVWMAVTGLWLLVVSFGIGRRMKTA